MKKKLKAEYQPGGSKRHVILDKAVEYLKDPKFGLQGDKMHYVLWCAGLCVYIFSFYLSVCAPACVARRPIWRFTCLRRASSSFSCLPSGAAFAINALYTLYRKIPYMSNFILSYPQLVAWRLKLVFFFYFRMQLRIILNWPSLLGWGRRALF